jgi:hypothetical protein
MSRSKTMPKADKVNACLIAAFVVVFYVFWELCKQLPALAQVATFTEDPYDAIAAVPLAVFLAFLTVIRAFRSYPSDEAQSNQRAFLMRGAYLVCLAVAVTVGADIVAMLRYPSVWIGKPLGFLLAALVGGMALLTTCFGWRLHVTTGEERGASRQRGWVVAIGISLVGAGICALYPQNWRQGFPTGGWGTAFILFTIVVGMMIQYTSVWAWCMVICPPKGPPQEDFLDDLAALYTLLKGHLGRFRVGLLPFEKACGSSLLHPVLNWMNPRKGRWYGIALIGIMVGVVLAFAEALGSGHLYPPLGLLRVYVVVECLAVLVGYAFFSRPLGLAHRDTADPHHRVKARMSDTNTHAILLTSKNIEERK